MDRACLLLSVALAMGCVARSDSDEGDGETESAEESGGATGSADGSGGGSASSGGSGGAGSSGGADSGESGEYDACEEYFEGGMCTVEGAVCDYADDCGGVSYTCQAGAWVQGDAWGCGIDAVPCSDNPAPGDSCDTEDVCDPDGDCLDVLECEGFFWASHDVCSEVACEEAAPQHGGTCELEEGRVCQIDHACGSKIFTCHDGYWTFNGGANCTDPVACEDGPVPYDACANEGEVCEYADPDEAPVTCTDGIWDK